MTESSIPVVELPAIDGNRTDATVHGILLAAGTSSRYGDANKLLATIEGEPIVRRAARSLVQSEVEDTIVVLGHEAESVREAIGDLDVTVVVNESYDQGAKYLSACRHPDRQQKKYRCHPHCPLETCRT